MQKWEYKFLHRTRGIKAPGDDGFRDSMDWNADAPLEEFQALGEAGWELVAVSNRSDYGGQIASTLMNPDGFGEAGVVPPVRVKGPVVAGMTTSQTFYFKRPKS